jgi:hypothetical protein
MIAEHGPKPGMSDYLLAAGIKLGALQKKNAGVTLTPPEQQTLVHDTGFTQLATEIRAMRGKTPSLGRALAQEIGGAIKRQIRRKRSPSQSKFVADAASMKDSSL